MRLEQIETPALIVDLDVMEQNMDTMDRLLKETPMKLRPHYKSNKCPAIVHAQLARGAKGITCAKLSEAEDLILCGVEDVLIANQITHPAKLARLAYLAKCCRLTVCVDDAQNIDALQAACAMQDSVLHCLVEFDVGMDRCGVHTREECLALAQQIGRCENLRFDGIQAYAGNLAHENDTPRRKAESEKVELRMRELKAYLEENGVCVQEISGISTGTVAFHGADSVYTEVQAGSYLFGDMAYRAVGVDFRNSLFVLTSVMSTHENAVITDAGAKSIAVDQKTPAFLGYEQYRVEMSEEHCALYGDLDLKVGDQLLLIPGHCCTTVNIYDYLYLVRGGKVVDRVPIEGRGKSR